MNADAIYIYIVIQMYMHNNTQYSHLHSLGRVAELGITVSLDTATDSVDVNADAAYIYCYTDVYA